MTTFSALTVFACLPVRDLDRAIDWYAQAFGRRADARPVPGIADYYLAADGVPEHGTLQLRQDEARAGGGLATINVSDISVVAAALAAVGVPFGSQDFPIEAETVASVTVGSFEDLDGNEVTIVQPHLRHG